jgi:single-strand DNA-binding protein
MNTVILIGRAGKDAEAIHFDNGGKLVKFSLATSEHYKNAAGEKVEETTWHNIVITGKAADVAETYVKKGMLVSVTGSIKVRSYEAEGQKKQAYEIRCSTIELLSRSEANGQASAKANEQQTSSSSQPGAPIEGINGGDDLPF